MGGTLILVDFRRDDHQCEDPQAESQDDELREVEPLLEDIGEVKLAGIDWMIVGGESGPGARPIDIQWVRSLRKQCRHSGVKFFFKQ